MIALRAGCGNALQAVNSERHPLLERGAKRQVATEVITHSAPIAVSFFGDITCLLLQNDSHDSHEIGHKTIAESMTGNGEIIKMLLKTCITNIDFRDCYVDISRIITALHRQEIFLKLFLDIGTNFYALGSKQCTVLQVGSANGHENMVEMLQGRGLRHHTGSFGENIFHAFDNLARAHECNFFEEAQRITWTTYRGLTVHLTRDTSLVPKTMDLYLIARESLLSDEAIWTEQSKVHLYCENILSLGNWNQI